MNILGKTIQRSLEEAVHQELRAMPIDDLKALWDLAGEADDHHAHGYDIADIHLILNERGEGFYCCV